MVQVFGKEVERRRESRERMTTIHGNLAEAIASEREKSGWNLRDLRHEPTRAPTEWVSPAWYTRGDSTGYHRPVWDG